MQRKCVRRTKKENAISAFPLFSSKGLLLVGSVGGQALGAIELWRKTFVKLYFSNVFCVKIVSSKETCLSNWTGNHFHFGIWIWQCNAVVAEDNLACTLGILIFPNDIKTVKCPIFGSTTQWDQATEAVAIHESSWNCRENVGLELLLLHSLARELKHLFVRSAARKMFAPSTPLLWGCFVASHHKASDDTKVLSWVQNQNNYKEFVNDAAESSAQRRRV